jgi:restriction system protein
MKPMWMVRAGRGGEHLEFFLAGNVGIGFGGESIGPVGRSASRGDLVDRYKQAHPSSSDGKAVNAASQIYRFHNEIQSGDTVVTYDSETRRYFVGVVTGPSEFQKTGSPPYLRSVSWEKKASRDALSVSTRNSLGSIMTLFLIPEDAAEELRAASQPMNAPDIERPRSKPDPTEEEASFENLREEVLEKAGEFIEDLLASLDPYEMQDLIAGILRAMGYKTRVSPKGADRGVDIFASPDGLGLQEPRIFVEVKHRRNTPMGSQDLRSFLGGRQQGDRCLYVSTGGFRKDARYEAERSNIPLRLIDLPALRELVVEHYEQLEPEIRQLIPLTRLYWPVDPNA